MVAAVAGAWLLTGCKTAPTTPVSRAEPPQVSRVTTTKAEARPAKAAKIASAHAHFAAGVVRELNGENDAALEEFLRAAAADPDDETLMLDVSRRLLLNKQPDKALDFLLAVTARGGAGGEIHARLGNVYAQLGRTGEAIAANRIAVKKSPRFLTGYQNLFFNLLANKQPAEALKLLDEAARLEGVSAEFLLGLGDLYQNYSQQFPTQREVIQKKALAVLMRAEKLKPSDARTRLRLADGFYILGENQRAAELYLPLLGQIDDLPLVLENVRAKLAEIYLRSDDHARAREQLEAIVRDDPANAQANYFLGSIAYDDQRWTDAVEHLRKTLVISPNFEPAYNDLAAAQLAAEDAAGALETMARARARFPQSFTTEYLTALAQGRQKNFAEAIKYFTSAEVIARAGDPKRLTAEFYFEVGIAFEHKGDRPEAEKYFELALKLKPEFPEVQNYLGYMWAERGEKLDRARDLIEQALKAEPKSAAYLDSMGWVLFKLNQPKPALDYMLKAVAENGKPDATLYDHLGDIYAALSQTDQAREAWQKSLSVEDSELVRKKLNPPRSP